MQKCGTDFLVTIYWYLKCLTKTEVNVQKAEFFEWKSLLMQLKK